MQACDGDDNFACGAAATTYAAGRGGDRDPRRAFQLILASQWPEKVGKGLVFISLDVDPDTHAAQVEALDALRAELEASGVPVKDGSWGYRLLVVDDPDGNQLYFNYPNEPA